MNGMIRWVGFIYADSGASDGLLYRLAYATLAASLSLICGVDQPSLANLKENQD
jgi:hypothetical protein